MGLFDSFSVRFCNNNVTNGLLGFRSILPDGQTSFLPFLSVGDLSTAVSTVGEETLVPSINASAFASVAGATGDTSKLSASTVTVIVAAQVWPTANKVSGAAVSSPTATIRRLPPPLAPPWICLVLLLLDHQCLCWICTV